jgi:hypothetical protein
MTLSSKTLDSPVTMSAPIVEDGSGGEVPAPKTPRKRAPRKQTKKVETKEE